MRENTETSLNKNKQEVMFAKECWVIMHLSEEQVDQSGWRTVLFLNSGRLNGNTNEGTTVLAY